MKKALNILLLITFIFMVMVTITGIHIHKLASLFFLLLCLVHTGVYWKKMSERKFLALGLVFTVFLSGLFGMIFEEYPIVLLLHKALSIVLVFCLAIHIFIFSSRLGVNMRTKRQTGRGRFIA